MTRFRPATAAALATTLGLTAACSSPLSGGEDEVSSAVELASTLEEWPELETAGVATTEMHPQVELQVRPLVRTDDGRATLTMVVDNQGNDDLTVEDLFWHSDHPGRYRIYDPEGNVRYSAVAAEDEDAGYCLCSSSSVTVPAGEAREVYATFAEIPEDVESVRVQISRFTPVDGVPVAHAGRFEAGGGQSVPVESDPDLQVVVDNAVRHEEGTLVRGRFINGGSAEPAALDAFPAPSSFSVVSGDADAVFTGRTDGGDVHAATDITDTDEPLAQGEEFPFEVLAAPVPDAVEEVFLRAPGLRSTWPVELAEAGDDVGGEPETFAVPRNLEDAQIFSLAGETQRYSTPMVATEAPAPPDVAEMGAELPEVPVTGSLTSDAQPDWEIAVRGVVRGPGPNYSTLLLDVGRGSDWRSWPEAVGVDGGRSNLGDVTVTDWENDIRYGVMRAGDAAFSAGSYTPGRDRTLASYAVLPALEPGVTEVDVDIPSFGTVEDVPVVDGPEEPADGDVPATMRVQDNSGLRMDVLEVSHLGDGNGTLVRARMVNESEPDAESVPFRNEGDGTLCDVSLYDPASGTRHDPLGPCVSTNGASASALSTGDALVQEVRFPELSDDVEQVVLEAGGWFPSGPVPVTGDGAPWYLSLPNRIDETSGGQYWAPVATVEPGEATTEADGVVEIVLEADVFFEFDSDELTDDAASRVAELASDIAETAEPGTVTIVGHTDSHGEDDYNQDLSEDRAESVREVLEAEADRSDLTFEVEGEGDSEPVAPNEIDGNDNPDGRERNRRVEITYEAG